MDIVQSFYDKLATEYDKLFEDWQATTKAQAVLLDKLFLENGYGKISSVLDCACGIGTQAIGLADLGYSVTASDFSEGALAEAKKRAEDNGVKLCFAKADFRALTDAFSVQFDIVIAMDNALPHMLTKADLEKAVKSIVDRIAPGGMLVASIRDYDALLNDKPPYSPPYIHKTAEGKRVAFQTWDWDGDVYNLVQYIIEDGEALKTNKFECAYRAVRRAELTELLFAGGCSSVEWKFPDETGFCQPIVLAKKSVI